MDRITPEVLRELADKLEQNAALEFQLQQERKNKSGGASGFFWFALTLGAAGVAIFKYLEVAPIL